MNKLHKIAMISLLSMSAVMFSTQQAKADEKDGTIERFVCLQQGVESGHLKSAYVKLNAKDAGQKLGFGGGDWAIRLSNDGEAGSGEFFNFAGGSATFVTAKKETQFKLYFKPVNVDYKKCRLFICIRLANGQPSYLYSGIDGFQVTKLANGWYTVGDDLDSFNGAFRGATVSRMTLVLNKSGDDGHILMGNTQVYSHKDLLDPSTLVMDKVPCSDSLICGAYNN